MARKRSLDGGPPTRDEILKAAAELFYQRGYGAVSIRDIGDVAGISSSTIYHYFGNKQDVLHAIIYRFMIDFVDALVGPLADESVTPTSRIQQMVATHLTFSEQRRPELLTANPFRNHLSPEQIKQVVPLQRRYHEAVRKCINAGVKNDEFMVDDSRTATMAILDALNGVREWFDPAGSKSLDDLVKEYQRLVLRLLGA